MDAGGGQKGQDWSGQSSEKWVTETAEKAGKDLELGACKHESGPIQLLLRTLYSSSQSRAQPVLTVVPKAHDLLPRL